MIASSPGGSTGLDYTMKTIAVGLEVVGVAVIVFGALVTFGVFLQRLIKEGSKPTKDEVFEDDAPVVKEP